MDLPEQFEKAIQNSVNINDGHIYYNQAKKKCVVIADKHAIEFGKWLFEHNEKIDIEKLLEIYNSQNKN